MNCEKRRKRKNKSNETSKKYNCCAKMKVRQISHTRDSKNRPCHFHHRPTDEPNSPFLFPFQRKSLFDKITTENFPSPPCNATLFLTQAKLILHNHHPFGALLSTTSKSTNTLPRFNDKRKQPPTPFSSQPTPNTPSHPPRSLLPPKEKPIKQI